MGAKCCFNPNCQNNYRLANKLCIWLFVETWCFCCKKRLQKMQLMLSGLCHTFAVFFFCSECSEDIQNSIKDRVSTMGEAFCAAYALPCNNTPASQASFAQNRLQFATMLYYKVLERIVETESKRLKSKAGHKSVDLSVSMFTSMY